ncbi:MAG: electron transporter RnfB [Methanomicrobia archaeon]|nr:electron transporter RnfB [Methanomicrobia archaeon]
MPEFDIVKVLIAIGVMLVLGGLLGFMLAVADKYLEVKVDERVSQVTAMLPGINCGTCGYPGCAGMAEGIVKGEVKKVSQCRPSKPEAREKIKAYLDATPGPDGSFVKVDI